MVVPVKVNSLEAYALLDTGSTMLSIMHNFTQVAKLRVLQLKNPVPLQLRMIGSCSMINFRTWACLELGPIIKNDAYMNVVNLNQYDMVLGMPFMHKHSLVLDFRHNILSAQNTMITMIITGQEDLMLTKQQVIYICPSTMVVKQAAPVAH